jgi:hypothetical protein
MKRTPPQVKNGTCGLLRSPGLLLRFTGTLAAPPFSDPLHGTAQAALRILWTLRNERPASFPREPAV